MSEKRRVVVIGAAGTICRQLLVAFRRRYDLVLLDTRDTDATGQPVQGVRLADLLDPNVEANRAHFREADAVVHCGFVSRPPSGGAAALPSAPDGVGDQSSPRPYFDAEVLNIRMCQHVFELGRLEGVKRVVVASSNHAADW